MLSLFGDHPDASACKCIPSPPAQEALQKADAVFSGVVERFEPDDTRYEEPSADPGQRKYVIKTRVLTAWITVWTQWKGVPEPRTKVNTAENTAVCGYPFAVGREYLIYGTRDRHGEIHASLCSRTRPMDEAGEDLKALGPGLAAAAPGSSP